MVKKAVLKSVLLVSILAMVLVGGAISVFAEEPVPNCQITNTDEGLTVPAYCDGRINAFDIAQPVAIFYTVEDTEAINDDGEAYTTQQITGIEVWGVDGDSNGYLALWVGIDAINAALVSDGNVQLGSAYGVTLTYVPAVEMFWVTAPGYDFTWDVW
jgi:hypothetical protein